MHSHTFVGQSLLGFLQLDLALGVLGCPICDQNDLQGVYGDTRLID